MAVCVCIGAEQMEEDTMSLLDESMDKCVYMNKVKTDDGYGGYIDSWQEGVEFDAVITFDTSIQARRAEQEGVSSLYTVFTSRSMTLEWHDVFKRLRDGKIFRVTSDGDDVYTPPSSALDLRKVTAEEWVLNG